MPGLYSSEPFIPEQPKVMLILEAITHDITLAQVSLIGKAQFKQQVFGWFIHYIDDRFNAM
jgi:hypothetical protein